MAWHAACVRQRPGGFDAGALRASLRCSVAGGTRDNSPCGLRHVALSTPIALRSSAPHRRPRTHPTHPALRVLKRFTRASLRFANGHCGRKSGGSKPLREVSGGCAAGVRGRLCAAEERRDRRKKKRACLSLQGEFARFPPGTSTAREPEGPAHLKPPGPRRTPTAVQRQSQRIQPAAVQRQRS